MIETLSSTGDGKGVLSVRIAPHITFKTWNNASSDHTDDTLIDPNSSVGKVAQLMQVGQFVTFGAQLILADVDCVRETSITLEGSMHDPEYLHAEGGQQARIACQWHRIAQRHNLIESTWIPPASDGSGSAKVSASPGRALTGPFWASQSVSCSQPRSPPGSAVGKCGKPLPSSPEWSVHDAPDLTYPARGCTPSRRAYRPCSEAIP
jgi:hypothetical protein